MSKPVTGSLPNLVNGISQQAPALRLATQAEAQDNFYSTIVGGLKDRPPTEFVAKLLSTLPSGVFTHIINRDGTERYIVVFDPSVGQVKVFDFLGTEHAVTAPNGWGYLSGITDPAETLRALTVADYTFITNTDKVVAADLVTKQASRPKEAIVNVLIGNYGRTYKVLINGGAVATFTTPDGSDATQSPKIDTIYIAQQLVNGLVASGFAASGWHVARYSNAIHLYHDTADFSITVEDGFNGNAMKVVKGQTQRFSDLPIAGPHGFTCEIVGDSGNNNDNYYIMFDTSAGGPGVWKETVKPGERLWLNSSTMPHALISNADGSFTFNRIVWDPRKCGNADTSPDPSFTGRTIADMFFHRNRLGFLADEAVILSRNGSFFDFYRTTSTALLDDDPIDVSASHVKVSLLKAAVPYQDDLVLFSDQTQFTLSGNDLLTPKTVSARPRTEYVCDGAVKPVGLGTSIYFTAKRGDYQSVWEYTIDRITQTASANEVTSHVPAYVPSGVYKIIGTSNESAIALLTKGDTSRIYVYRYFDGSDGNRLQSAWQRWTFPGNPVILNAEFVSSDLYVVLKRSDGVYLEKIRMQPNAFDEGVGFLVALDQRVHSDQLAAPTYDDLTDVTTFTLPYQPRDGIRAVTAPGGTTLTAIDVPVLSIDAGTKKVNLFGDLRTAKVWFGFPFERRYKFSRFYLRQPSPSGGTTTVQSGRLQIKGLNLSYDKSAYFRVEVTPVGRKTYTYTFTGRALGSADNVLGSVPLIAGKMSIPILSRNDRVSVELVNDSWMPSSFISAEWSGTHNATARDL
jgi:hypothetical protein